MKRFISCLTIITLLLLVSCDKDKHEPLVCGDDDLCLFVVENQTGEIVMMNCFEKYAIKSVHPEDASETIYGIPESVEEKFQVEGMEVNFSAKFRLNTLEPLFPDPSFNPSSLYEITIVSIE